MDFTKLMKMFNENDIFVSENGIVITSIETGVATAELTITNHHLNANNVIQGGALFTMIDISGCAAVLSYGEKAVTLNANINYLAAVASGKLTATATVVKKGKQTALSNVEIKNEQGKLIATGTVTVFIVGGAIFD